VEEEQRLYTIGSAIVPGLALAERYRSWANCKQQGFCLSVKIPGKAITAYGKRGRWEESVRVLRDMKGMNLERNVVCFTSAIDACARRKQWKCALELLQEMGQESISANVISYNAAISACEKGEQWEKALKTWSLM